MTDPVGDHLLGYLLGALEDAEYEAVEDCLRCSPKLQRELQLARELLEPLDAARCDFLPPVDLAARTCRRVASRSERSKPKRQPPPRQSVPATASRSVPAAPAAMSDEDGASGWVSGLRWQDVVVGGGVLVAVALLLFPAIEDSRFQARLMDCQDNLRQIGLALTQYSQYHHGHLPPLPVDERRAAGGIYASTLWQSGCLGDPRCFICPDSPLARDHGCDIPVLAAAKRKQLDRLQHWMRGGGHFGPGCAHDGGYRGTIYPGRSNLVLLAYSQAIGQAGCQGDDHYRDGRNVLFEDCRVEFLVFPRLHPTVDDFSASRRGQMAAGVYGHSSVVDHSDSPPITSIKAER